MTVAAIRSRFDIFLFSKSSNAFEVLQLRTVDIRSQLDANEVRVRWLASPINPLDINKIEGVYGGVGVRRPPPAEVVGAEAVGRVEAVSYGF
jgi:NADPH:quinone reductase-like Zn-dependent oxidoreductase